MNGRRAWLAALLLAASAVAAQGARAFISQEDGTPLPQSPRMQQCLDRPGTGETVAGAVDAVEDAKQEPEAFRPVESEASPGTYPVQFLVIGEGAGFRNTFGYYWTDEDPTDFTNLHMIFDCRPGGTCACPCDPDDMRGDDGSDTAWRRTIDFSREPGFSPGRAIGFWIRTPEQLDGSRDEDNCGGPDAGNQNHRTYFTSRSLNDDGDFVHYLVYTSATHADNFYFGFEDLFRGGDNDFEDFLVRADGLVPLCVPQPETCNGEDDDCDMAVDEGVTRACTTACGSGVRACVGGTFGSCSAPDPTDERCNAIDDDCDGRVDEGLDRACSTACGAGREICVAGEFVDCDAPTPTIELCNAADDDCDGAVDESITRACFTGCGSGVETCVAGVFGGCTAPLPGVESCNGVDDDCDGLTDEGITRPCATDCGEGIETCISGAFVGCTAPAGGIEACNGADDDCDGAVDEMLSRACTSACGPGTEICEAGEWVGCDAPAPGVEECNNVDDDCNGVIDDGVFGGEPCVPDAEDPRGYRVVSTDEPVGVCIPGRVRCVGGELSCTGASSPRREICNCDDDDCDGVVDEGSGDGICPGGLCLDCSCVSPCADEEFPCPPGRECDTSLADPAAGIPGYCVVGACAGVDCPDDETCEASTGECIDLCDRVRCGDGDVCVRGGCFEDSCYGLGCEPGERCGAGGACEADPCLGVTCGAREFCRDGACVAACDEACPAAGEVCRDGVCAPDPCGARCDDGATCVDGRCVANACEGTCGRQRVCLAGECVHDACSHIECPSGTECVAGGCFDPDALPRPEPRRALAAGGGGCAAAGPTGTSATPSAALLALALLGLLAARRRRGLALAGALALTLGAGCDVDPFCFEECGGDAGGADAGRDAGRRVSTDGCVVAGEETCNGVDDDCNGLVDDGFDVANDPRNCGACGRECIVPNAFPACELGECEVARCEIGFVDLDDNPVNGCEYACLTSGSEICDGVDNDCDFATDEGFELDTDVSHCGACNARCSFPGAEAICAGGECRMGDCLDGFVDADGLPETGCELACAPTGPEVCNGADDDCDGRVDEGFDLRTDPSHCGRCRNACDFPRAEGACVDGVCGIARCEVGFVDVDRDPRTGCEYECTPRGDDVCNGLDDDCDGAVDESDPDVGDPCGSDVGECRTGTTACQFGRLICVMGRGPTPETCNGTDDDCDGESDESPPGEAIPGTGVRCGETDLGECRFGTVRCGPAGLECGGAYVAPAAELCNGLDDDCDGVADDSPRPPAATPPSCALDRGVCAGRTPVCRGAGGWGCDDPAGYQIDETICDGLDNDCDGPVDEGCLVVAPATDRRVDRGDSTGEHNSVQPDVSGDGSSRVYATWMDLRQGDDVARIYYSRSTNRGDSWLVTAGRVDGNGGAGIGPRIAVGGGGDGVAVVWSDFDGGDFRQIWSRSSDDGLASWGRAGRRDNVGQDVDSFGLDVAVSGARVYAVYETFTSVRSRHVFLLRSSDGGRTFNGPTQVDHGSGSTFVAATPQVAAVGTNVYVVWRDNRSGALDVYFNRSTDGGASFRATDTRLDVGTTAGSSSSFSPTIAAEGANVHVAWVDDRSGDSFDIWTNRSRDSGATWRAADALPIDDDPLPHDSLAPRVVTTGAGEAVVAWVDFRFGFPDVLVARTEDGGDSYERPQRVDTGTGPGSTGSFDVSVDARGQLVGVAWADDRDGLLDIYANFSLDGGRNFQPTDYRMDSTAVPGSSDSVQPQVYVASDAVHVLWVDHRAGANADLYSRRLE